MTSATERFLRYIALDTQSAGDAQSLPSTEKQFALANVLVEEMRALGIDDARVSEHCYVYGSIPANAPGLCALGFIAHLDTSPAASGANVRPRIVHHYDGGDIPLNAGVKIEASLFPALARHVGQDLIVTDGTTLLGADDKAGIAEILTMAEYLRQHPEIRHGRICIGFTPDEEVGHGPDAFDLAAFGADFAYTVDGGELGEIEYENFNAAEARAVIRGRSIHPGTAKGRMINALNVAMEFHALLPVNERPEHTEGYEGFFHLDEMRGDVSHADLLYLIRDHDRTRFEARKAYLRRAAEFVNARYGQPVIALQLRDSYYNMREKIKPHMHLIDTACAAMRALEIEPRIQPIRGGTDGARLSFQGLPCPNLCTGGHNAHGAMEFISVQALETVSRLLVKIVEKTYA